jgi:pimeloyl-ACP methyl ester carboxylesterase
MDSFEDYKAFADLHGIRVADLHEGEAAVASAPMTTATPEPIPPDGPAARGKGRLAILLHGFAPIGRQPFTPEQSARGEFADYQLFFDRIRERLPGYSFVVPTYNTHASFVSAAAILGPIFKSWADRFDLSRTIIVGYSMGGLVARQLVADGLPFARLYTTCTPHHGILPYLFAGPPFSYFVAANAGASSMAPYSVDLARLNATDVALRPRYHVHGVNYTDLRLFHNDDTITDCNGATMVGSPVAARWATHIGLLSTIEGLPFQPHLRGYMDTREWFSSRWAPEEFVRIIVPD